MLLWEPGCSHLGKEKDLGKQQGKGAGEELSLQFALFALSDAALPDQQSHPHVRDTPVWVTPHRHTATATNRAEFLSRVQDIPSILLLLQMTPNTVWPHWSHGLLLTTS